jgi:flagellar biosynthetic protein FliP
MQGQTVGTIVQLFGLLTVLSLAPGILIMVTSFTRFIIVFSILRSGLGLPSTPANLILISLSLFMTFYVMGPTFDRAWNEGMQPLVANEIDETEAFARISDPFRDFMAANVRDKDFDLFADLARERGQADVVAQEADFRILVPAFMISEIRRGFEIGFLIVLPFLVIDLIVATITMSMGMMMLPPVVVSLPFKILFFVLIDGWNLLVGSLVRSFA